MVFAWIVSLAIYVSLVVWTSSIASKKGRNSIGWAVFALFFPVLSLIVVSLVSSNLIPTRSGHHRATNAPPTSTIVARSQATPQVAPGFGMSPAGVGPFVFANGIRASTLEEFWKVLDADYGTASIHFGAGQLRGMAIGARIYRPSPGVATAEDQRQRRLLRVQEIGRRDAGNGTMERSTRLATGSSPRHEGELSVRWRSHRRATGRDNLGLFLWNGHQQRGGWQSRSHHRGSGGHSVHVGADRHGNRVPRAGPRDGASTLNSGADSVYEAGTCKRRLRLQTCRFSGRWSLSSTHGTCAPNQGVHLSAASRLQVTPSVLDACDTGRRSHDQIGVRTRCPLP